MKKLVCYLILAVFLLLPTGTASAELFSGTFVDTRGHWAESEIEIACKQGLMEGAGVNESGIRIFSPEQTADRFQLATVLERAFDLDYGNMRFIKQPKASDYYYDLEEEAWYSEAVLICAINHIFAPMDRFEGEKELTRIEAARSIYNAFQSKGITVPTIMMMPLYDDTGALSQDETNAMVFVSNTGIMKGNDNHFRPYDAIKRAELARVLNQCVKLIEMNPVEVSPTPAVKLECKEIKSESPPLKIDLNIPVITGLQDEQIQTLINQIVEDEAKQRQKAMTEEAQVIYREMRMEDFSVNWNSTNNSGFIPAEPYQPYEIVSRFNQYYLTRDILSFYVDYYTYTGGAHGMTDRVAYNFDLCTGQQLALRNLFFPDTNYHEIIDERIRSAIELDPEVYFEGDLGFQGIGEDQRFYLENGNLVVYFLQYEIAPYAAGIRTFSVPFLPPKQLTQNSDETAVMQLVADFGSKLKNVSLLAPQDIVKNSLQESYGSLVSPALLAKWQNDVNKAPGRATSSPWPERIEITAMEKLSDSKYQIKGEVITMTSVEMVNGGVAGKRPVTLQAEKIDNNWLITSYEYDEATVYRNEEFGFTFNLPESWQGYSIIADNWEGIYLESAAKDNEPLFSIRHPQWTEQNPRQDIPIMVFTHNQWDMVQKEALSVGAAPIPPKELGRNSKYVFALPARYNFAFPTGYEEVEKILETDPLQTFETRSPVRPGSGNWQGLTADYNPPAIDDLLAAIKNSTVTNEGDIAITADIKREFSQMGEDYRFFYMPEVSWYDFDSDGAAIRYMLYTWSDEFGVFPEQVAPYQAEARVRKLFAAPDDEYPPLLHQVYPKFVRYDGSSYSLWPESYNTDAMVYDLVESKVRKEGDFTYYTATANEYGFDVNGYYEPGVNEKFLLAKAKVLGLDYDSALEKLLTSGQISGAEKNQTYKIEFRVDNNSPVPEIVSVDRL